tara:strand:- start:280 stop:687 length:408 start_codon:yes stop_codon:yes gene_type:complete
MQLIKNIKLGILSIFINLSILVISLSQFTYTKAQVNLVGQNTSIKILDKISSKNESINLINGEDTIYKDLVIKSMKCINSEFDDIPEIKAYIQVRDLTKNNNNIVYVFNNWMFSSSPSITPFDHPVYDIWLTDCN